MPQPLFCFSVRPRENAVHRNAAKASKKQAYVRIAFIMLPMPRIAINRLKL